MDLKPTPLLPDGFEAPASRWIASPSAGLRLNQAPRKAAQAVLRFLNLPSLFVVSPL